MNDGFQKRKPRKPVELQLNSIADIVSIIILYLIVSTVFGVSNLNVPGDLKLPESTSKEDLDVSPQLLIHGGTVELSTSGRKVGVEAFIHDTPESNAYLSHLRSEVDKQKKLLGKKQLLLSLVADKKLKYGILFPVVRKVRQAGFETVIFVATGEK